MNFAWAVYVFRKGSHFRTESGGNPERAAGRAERRSLGLYATMLFLVGIVHLVAQQRSAELHDPAA